MALILVGNREAPVNDIVRAGLQTDGHTVSAAQSGPALVELLETERFDLAVLDVSLPILDGLEVCRRIRKCPITSDLPVVFLTSRDTTRDRVRGFEAGCDDYVAKPFSVVELRWRIRAILRRRSAPSRRAPLSIGPLRLDPNTYKVNIEEHDAMLTPIEYKLLRYLIENAGRVFSSQQLLNQVWGYPPGCGNTGLVRTHIKNLRTKLEGSTEIPSVIQTVPRHGYTLNVHLNA
jgi:DNA-binding response OmpR family regulator